MMWLRSLSRALPSRLRDLSATSGLAWLVDGATVLCVDVSGVSEGLALKPYTWYEFVGLLRRTESSTNASVCLVARIGRCVAGVDMALYREALKARRLFLAATAAAAGGTGD